MVPGAGAGAGHWDFQRGLQHRGHSDALAGAGHYLGLWLAGGVSDYRYFQPGLVAVLVGLEHARLLCQKMLPALDYFLGKISLSLHQRQRLLKLPIFPVTQGESHDDAYASTTSFRRAQDTFWIADLNWLKSKFEGLLPLLDLTGSLFKSSMDNIFDKLSMDSKRLSKSVKKEEQQPNQQVASEVPGDLPEDLVLTNRLRRQSRYIIG